MSVISYICSLSLVVTPRSPLPTFVPPPPKRGGQGVKIKRASEVRRSQGVKTATPTRESAVPYIEEPAPLERHQPLHERRAFRILAGFLVILGRLDERLVAPRHELRRIA